MASAQTASTQLAEGSDSLPQIVCHCNHFQPTAEDTYLKVIDRDFDYLQPSTCDKHRQKTSESKNARLQRADNCRISNENSAFNIDVSYA